jgi:hypothetical protein
LTVGAGGWGPWAASHGEERVTAALYLWAALADEAATAFEREVTIGRSSRSGIILEGCAGLSWADAAWSRMPGGSAAGMWGTLASSRGVARARRWSYL